MRTSRILTLAATGLLVAGACGGGPAVVDEDDWVETVCDILDSDNVEDLTDLDQDLFEIRDTEEFDDEDDARDAIDEAVEILEEQKRLAGLVFTAMAATQPDVRDGADVVAAIDEARVDLTEVVDKALAELRQLDAGDVEDDATELTDILVELGEDDDDIDLFAAIQDVDDDLSAAIDEECFDISGDDA